MTRFVVGDDCGQSTSFPERLDDYLGEDNPVRAIDVLVDELDLAKLGFDGVEPEATGRPAYHPATLLKIYVYGYLNRVQSSRRLERECQPILGSTRLVLRGKAMKASILWICLGWHLVSFSPGGGEVRDVVQRRQFRTRSEPPHLRRRPTRTPTKKAMVTAWRGASRAKRSRGAPGRRPASIASATDRVVSLTVWAAASTASVA